MPYESKPYVIVVGIDYSEVSELAFDRALELAAEEPRADLHVLNVIEASLPMLPLEIAYPSPAVLPSMQSSAERLEKYVEKKLALFRAARGSATNGMRVVSHLRSASPTFEVAQLAADLEADIVVVGTHGRRALSRMVLGSVAEVTVRLSPCPVLVVRPKSAPAPIPAIEPPCPRCLEARKASGSSAYWCAQHRERHGQRHTYHQGDRSSAETNLPLVFR